MYLFLSTILQKTGKLMSFILDFLTLEDDTDRLSRNVGKELPLYAD